MLAAKKEKKNERHWRERHETVKRKLQIHYEGLLGNVKTKLEL
jgi:hypothetical protein